MKVFWMRARDGRGRTLSASSKRRAGSSSEAGNQGRTHADAGACSHSLTRSPLTTEGRKKMGDSCTPTLRLTVLYVVQPYASHEGDLLLGHRAEEFLDRLCFLREGV